MSNNAPPPMGPPSQQFSRSKSLNDISNDSQISAFASDRFINLHNNNNNNNGTSPSSHGKDPTTFMPVDNPYIYNQHNNDVNLIHPQNAVGMNSNIYNNIQGNLAFDNSRNLNGNQCSRPANANVYNLCNPLAINLNGVTEQIGNLHL